MVCMYAVCCIYYILYSTVYACMYAVQYVCINKCYIMMLHVCMWQLCVTNVWDVVIWLTMNYEMMTDYKLKLFKKSKF